MRPSPLGEARGSEALSAPIDERGERWVLTVKVERGMLASGTFLGSLESGSICIRFLLCVYVCVVCCVLCVPCLFVCFYVKDFLNNYMFIVIQFLL